MVMLNSESIGLIFSPSYEVHADKFDDKADGLVQIHEEEKVQEIWLVLETERLNDALITESEGEAEEHDDEGDAW